LFYGFAMACAVARGAQRPAEMVTPSPTPSPAPESPSVASTRSLEECLYACPRGSRRAVRHGTLSERIHTTCGFVYQTLLLLPFPITLPSPTPPTAPPPQATPAPPGLEKDEDELKGIVREFVAEFKASDTIASLMDMRARLGDEAFASLMPHFVFDLVVKGADKPDDFDKVSSTARQDKMGAVQSYGRGALSFGSLFLVHTCTRALVAFTGDSSGCLYSSSYRARLELLFPKEYSSARLVLCLPDDVACALLDCDPCFRCGSSNHTLTPCLVHNSHPGPSCLLRRIPGGQPDPRRVQPHSHSERGLPVRAGAPQRGI